MKKGLIFLLPIMIMIGCLILPFYLNESEVDMKTIQKVLDSHCTDDIRQGTSMQLRTDLHVSDAQYEESLFYTSNAAMSVNGMFVIRSSSAEDRETIMEKCYYYIDKRKSEFAGYGVSQMELLNHASVFTKGEYVFCLIMEHGDEIKAEIERVF